MKRNILFKALAVVILGTAALEAEAQGIYVNKKNGESISYPKATFDRVTPIKASAATGEYAEGVVAELQYEQAADMKTPRMGHQIFPSGNGFVVVGGHTTDFELTTTAEIFENGHWRDLSISSPHDGAFSLIMSDGRVMIGGGFSTRHGVGQSKNVDIYDPATQTFTAGPELSVARAFSRAIEIGGKVYVSGNWYADDVVLDYYDGSSFKSVGDMDERTRPYLFSDKEGNVYSVSFYSAKNSKEFGFTTLDDGTPALSGDKYNVAEGTTYYYRYPLFAEWVPLDLSVDARVESSHYVVDGSHRYLVLTKKDDSYLLTEVCPDDGKTYTRNKFSIPTKNPATDETISYRGSVIFNADKTECYLIGTSGTGTNRTIHIVSYNMSNGYWTIASAGGFAYNLMEGAWTLLSDGRLACAGGNVKDNYDAQKGVYIFTPAKAGASTSGTEYGVNVYKADGSYDTYMDSELESITTYEEEFDERIAQEIPVEYLSKMSAYMPIYSGNTPPNIEGAYLLSPATTVYDETGYYAVGKVISDIRYLFSNQDMAKNTVDFGRKEGDSHANATASPVIGNGKDFTCFSIEEGETSGIYTKIASLISGTKTDDGIRNLYYCILMIKKGDDPNHKVMAEGAFRAFKDGDSMSESIVWESRLRAAKRELGGESLQDSVSTAPARKQAMVLGTRKRIDD